MGFEIYKIMCTFVLEIRGDEKRAFTPPLAPPDSGRETKREAVTRCSSPQKSDIVII